jgi:hypothetical protein
MRAIPPQPTRKHHATALPVPDDPRPTDLLWFNHGGIGTRLQEPMVLGHGQPPWLRWHLMSRR